LLWFIADFKGRELKKEYAHPKYPKRTIPRIISIKFSTYGHGYFVSAEMSFWEFNYEPGWTINIAEQGKGEYIGDFLKRALDNLKEITVEQDDRQMFEDGKHFIDFHKRGCFNCEWHEKENCGICGLMDFHKIKNPKISLQGMALCDEWRLRDFGNGTSND
jgi:hypothetical protein